MVEVTAEGSGKAIEEAMAKTRQEIWEEAWRKARDELETEMLSRRSRCRGRGGEKRRGDERISWRPATQKKRMAKEDGVSAGREEGVEGARAAARVEMEAERGLVAEQASAAEAKLKQLETVRHTSLSLSLSLSLSHLILPPSYLSPSTPYPHLGQARKEMHQQLAEAEVQMARAVEKAKVEAREEAMAEAKAEAKALLTVTSSAPGTSASAAAAAATLRADNDDGFGGTAGGGPELSHSESLDTLAATQSKFVESELELAELQTRSLTAAMDASRAAMDGLASAREAIPIESEERRTSGLGTVAVPPPPDAGQRADAPPPPPLPSFPLAPSLFPLSSSPSLARSLSLSLSPSPSYTGE